MGCPEGVDPPPRAPPAWRHADLREDAHRQDRHAGGRAVRLDRQREGEDPGQGGHPARPAAPDLRRQAARGRPHPVGLQHPEGVDAPPGAPLAWWCLGWFRRLATSPLAFRLPWRMWDAHRSVSANMRATCTVSEARVEKGIWAKPGRPKP